MRSIVWFRRDLRISDNKALFYASEKSQEIIAVYFITPKQWQRHDEAPAKISFWMENLKLLQAELSKLNIPLLIKVQDSFADIPGELAKIAEEYNCQSLWFNREYEVNEKLRDEKVIAALRRINVVVNSFHDRILIEPGKVLTAQGKPYSVFTPFKKNWIKKIYTQDIKVLSTPKPLNKCPEIKATPIKVIDSFITDRSEEFCLAGGLVAKKRLKGFFSKRIQAYDTNRDIPSIDGTSQISPYLAAGILSPRQCTAELIKISGAKDRFPDFDTGAGTWLNEIIWREFYTQVMIEFPRVSKNLPFKLATDRIAWEYNPKLFEAWKNGLTGYPIVDAAMRQLKETGWMHNRLRMVAAMFLSKHLLHNWRMGEKWFMQNLIDGDLAANNGGWQWSASTGTDAVPYFRVFNPFSQSKRYDTKGEFIKKYCPELQAVASSSLHDPVKLVAEIKSKNIAYPLPIVEHSFARARAIECFKKLSASNI